MELLMIGKAAREIGVSVDRLRDWCKAGMAPHALTLGGRYRFTRAQISEIQSAMGTNTNDANTTATRAPSRNSMARPARV